MAVRMRVDPGSSPDDTVARFSARNPDLRVEQLASGDLLVTPPAGGWSGHCGAELVAQVGLWNRRTQFGLVFDASTGFRLPNGELRSPDVALVAAERFAALTSRQQQGYLPLCPDLAIEVQSPSDADDELSAKLRMFRDNGAEVTIRFDPAGAVEVDTVLGRVALDRPATIELTLSAHPHDPLVLDLAGLYHAPT